MVLAFSGGFLEAQVYDSLISRAESLYEGNNYLKSANTYEKAFSVMPVDKTEDYYYGT